MIARVALLVLALAFAASPDAFVVPVSIAVVQMAINLITVIGENPPLFLMVVGVFVYCRLRRAHRRHEK